MTIRIFRPFIRAKFLTDEEFEKECFEKISLDDTEWDAFRKVNEAYYCKIIKIILDDESVNAMIYGVSDRIIIAALGWHEFDESNKTKRLYYPTWTDLAKIGINDLMLISAILDMTEEYNIIPKGDRMGAITFEIAKQLERGLHDRFPDHIFKAGHRSRYDEYGEEPDWAPDYYFKAVSQNPHNADDRTFLNAVRVLGDGCTIYNIAKHCEWDRRKAAKLGDKLEKRGTIRTVKSERNHRRVRLVYLNHDML